MRRLALCALAVLVLSAGLAQAATVTLGAKANGTTVRVHVGDVLVLRLAANASTGYGWQPTAAGAPVLKLLGTTYVNAPNPHHLVGAPGTYVARFAVRAKGTAKIALRYARHTTPPSPAADTYALTVVAR